MPDEEELITINGLEAALSNLKVERGGVLVLRTNPPPSLSVIESLRGALASNLGFMPLLIYIPPGEAVESLDAHGADILIKALQQNALLRAKPTVVVPS